MSEWDKFKSNWEDWSKMRVNHFVYEHDKEIQALQSKLDICTTTLNYIESHKWVSNPSEPHKWINEFCEVSRIALEQINKLKGEK